MKKILLFNSLFFLFSIVSNAQIVLEFCPVDKVQATDFAGNKQFNATLVIRNNTNVVLDLLNNKFKMEWPSLISLPYPFSSGVQSGIDWEFKIEGVHSWDSKLPVGISATKTFSGAKYSGVLMFPTNGTLTQNGVTYTVEVKHCAKTNAFELYDSKFDFDRNCFLESPKSNMCLGEGASEVWAGEGVYDIMYPKDRPSWAIGVMVAHRLFTNLAGIEMLSPNFWTATALNESRMTCDNTIVPNQKNYCYINSGVNECQLNSPGNKGGMKKDNCFQVLNIGYAQISDNQPDLFSQTNAYGTATYNTIVGSSQWETGALAVTYYHYQDIQYWNQIFCWNAHKFHKDAKDPYAVEKVFYHAYHDGANDGISLLKNIDANYNAAISASDMNTAIGGSGTWASTTLGSQKVANFTSLLDGNGTPYPTQKINTTTKYYGCYQADIKWSDILSYLDKIKILYPQVMTPTVQSAIKTVFDGLNGGAAVSFSNLGPVIDEIVVQLGGHDPSKYIATQFSASKVCPGNPVGVSLRTVDTLCPGESGFLQVWLAGDPTFKVDIKFPDGSIKKYSNINASPFNIAINQPGDYEVVYFEDADQVGDINCNFAKITVQSKNGSNVSWDKSKVTGTGSSKCATGDLIVKKTGNQIITISYKKDGVAQPNIIMQANETSKTIATNVVGGEYIITTISPNSCGTPINDTIRFCNTTCTKPQLTIPTYTNQFCANDSVLVRYNFTGVAPYKLYLHNTVNNTKQNFTNINANFIQFYVKDAVNFRVDSLLDKNCKNDTITRRVIITKNPIPIFDLGKDTTICASKFPFAISGPAGMNTYTWTGTGTPNTANFSASASGKVVLKVVKDGCSFKDSLTISTKPGIVVNLGADKTQCDGTVVLDAGPGFNSYVWNGNVANNQRTFTASSTGQYRVAVATIDGCVGFDTINVTINAKPTFDLGKDTTICASKFPFALSGPSGMNTYTWTGTGTPTGANFSVSAAGKVVLNVVKNGCSFKDSLTISTKPGLVVNLGADKTQCDGTVVLDAGAGFNSYVWNGNVTNNQRTFTASSTGQYRVAVATNDGCVGFDTINVTINPKPNFDLGKDTSICASKFPFALSGPTGMNTYTWTGTGTPNGANFSASSAGKVVLNVVKDGCSFKDSVTISTKPGLVVNLGNDKTQCDGSLVLDAGSGFNSYVWNGNPANNQRTFTATTSGEYRVAVATADGCVGFDTINVTINTTPTVNIGDTATICPTSPAYVFNATRPNATYVWSDGSINATLSTTTQGDYWVDVTVNGCTARDSAYLLVSSTLNVNIGGDQTVCPGVEAEFTTNFINATYNWNNGASTQSTFKTSSAGTVTVTVTDAGGCEGTATAQVIVNNPLSINLGNNVAFCIGDSATLALNPTRNGLNYNWNTGATTASLKVKTAGTYTLNVDSAGCTAQSSVDVVVNNLPTVDLGEDTFVCAGVNTVLTLDAGTGMQSYQWGGGASGTNRTLNVNAVGTYHVRVVDANNCVNRDTIEITERVGTPISLMDAPKEVTICPGGNHIATVPTALQNVANTSWIWNDGTTGITNEVANRVDGENVGVSIAFTNQFGCVSRDSITVKVRNTLPINIQAQTICEGEDITFNSGYSGNNYTYVWNNDVANNQATFTINNATVAQSGNISIQVTSNEGCSGDTTVTLTVNALPQPILSNDTLCAGENLVLNTGVNGSHVWSDGSTNNTLSISNATPNQSGIYSVTVTNAQNCSKDTSMRLTVYANPDFEIVSPAAACEGKTVVLSTTAPSNTHTVLWNGGSLGNTFNANTSGTYTALVTHILSGCTATKNTTLNFLTTPTVILPQDTTLCEGATWNLRALNNSSLSTYNLNWSTGASTNNITVRINGLYWLEAKNGNCASRDSIWIDYSALPVSDLVADTTICFDDAPEIILNPGRYGGQTYVWNDGSTDPVYVAKEKGRYSVEITNEFGCKIISGTEIFEDCPFAVWIPNGFTPNEDGKNDKLTIMGRGIDEVQMYIFNRWGTLIWTGNAIGDGWDGKINGNLVQQDVYVYKVDFKYTDNKNIIKSKSRTGTIVVYR